MCALYLVNMYVLQEAKQQVLKELKNAIGKGYSPAIDELSTPPDSSMGDIAFPCFAVAKGMKKNPVEVASELAAKIGPKEFIKRVDSDGPYVNFTFEDKTFGKAMLKQISDRGSLYGQSTIGKNKTVLVEFASVNTHKVMHIGHLRNFSVGQMATNVLKANGYEVVPGFYINDLGLHVAQVLWSIAILHKGEEPDKDKRMDFLGKAYVEAVKKSEKTKKVKKEIAELYRELEDLKGPHVALWKKTRKWSMDYFRERFKELGLTLEFEYFESDLIQDTKDAIEDLIERGIVTHSEGAWIVDLNDENLGVNLLVKSDGSLLYNAKDIALAYQKEEDYHPHRSIYVVDTRQAHVMKQLFATMKRIGLDREMYHLSYDFVTLKGGAMSSRKGTIIRYEEFRDKLLESARKETVSRHKDWSEKKIESTSRAIAFAAMRFGMLKQDLDKKIIFDLEEALSFDGFTGPYLLYSFARMKSLIKKAKKMKPEFKGELIEDEVEHRLLVLLAEYPEVVFKVGESLHLSTIAQYLFDLSKTFAEFYEKVPVLQAEESIAKSRLAVVQSTMQVLENGLKLLGIDTVDEM